MPKFGRKFLMGLIGTIAIAVVGYLGSQWPALEPLVPWIVSAIAGLTGLTAATIAYEDGKHAEARANVQAAEHYSVAAMAAVDCPPEGGGR